MDYFSDYQPILVGAGCLALGYMFGRHCRAAMENQGDAPTTSDAACCAQITDPISVDAKRAYEGDEVFEKPEKCAKRDLTQLDVFDPHFFHKMPRKKDDMMSAFKKQKSAPLMREVVRTKADDSDDEVLAQRLEFFTKSEAGTRASINKPRDQGDPVKKIHVTRSLSGLGALATPLDDESSLDDTCRSPKTVCLECCAQDNAALEVVTNSALQTETIILKPLINEEDLGNDVVDHTVVVLPTQANMEVDAHGTDAVMMQLQSRLPTSPPPELLLHDVRDRCTKDQEEVPLHKLVKAKVHSTGKAESKVVSGEDEAHIVPLVGEAVDTCKLFQEEEAVEASEQRPSRQLK